MITKSWIRFAVVLAILSKPSVEGICITKNPIEVNNKAFSYVIVGGGTAGLTVASRLAEDPRISVLVVEAGPDAQNDTLISDPKHVLAVRSAYEWQYNTTAQTIGGRPLPMIQGKVLGGSSSINGMSWTRATVEQYDSLEELGNPGWNFESMLSYMKKAELFNLPNSQQIARGATAIPTVHGLDGKVDAGFPQPYEASVFGTDLVYATLSAIPGLVHNPDVNSGIPNGIARFQYSIKPGNNSIITANGNKRSTSANAYIYPSLQEKPNLVILTGHQATGLLWRKRNSHLSTASGVKFIPTSAPGADPGPEYSVMVKNEAIVASGAIGSPHFLELSGIGDTRILAPLGIPVEVNLPAVGTNLQDQSLNLAGYTVQPDIPASGYSVFNAPDAPAVIFLDLEQALGKKSARLSGDDLLRSIPHRVKQIVSSGAFTSESGLEKILSLQAKSIIELKAPVLEFSFLTTSQLFPGIAVIGLPSWNLLPQWRGTVHIKSANPNVHPELDPQFFVGSSFDLHLKGNATLLARKILNTMPLKKYILTEISPGLDAVPKDATDSQVQEFVKSSYTPAIHPVGSVPMLPRHAGGAVGPDLVVYGTTNVRVVDSSIIPIQLSAHLSSTVYGIAEKAADMIKNTNKMS